MRPNSTILALALLAAGACAKAPPSTTTPVTAAASAAPTSGLRIKLTSVVVDDQEKAVRFYTDVLGFAKKDDFTNSGYRWVTVTAAGDPDAGELLLELVAAPAAKAYQEAKFKQGQPAVMFYTDDVKGQYERIKARGAEFTMPPTEVMAGSVIATLNDTCGNLVQLTQLAN